MRLNPAFHRDSLSPGASENAFHLLSLKPGLAEASDIALADPVFRCRSCFGSWRNREASDHPSISLSPFRSRAHWSRWVRAALDEVRPRSFWLGRGLGQDP